MESFVLNGESYPWVRDVTVTELLEARQLLTSTGIAVAVNEEVLPKAQWDEYQIQQNDQILIITATQGG